MGALQTTQIYFSESSNLLSDSDSSYFWLQLLDFLRSERETVGISHMTDDLLGKIFYHLCVRGPLPLRHLLFVSKRFYSATVNNAHLWTTICLDSPFYHHFRQSPEQGDAFVEQCLLRSGSLPLCLYINCSGLNPQDLTFLYHPLNIFEEPEWEGFQRCTSLLMWNRSGYGGRFHEYVTLLPNSLPSLKYISLSHFGGSSGGYRFPNCPVLERVEMFNNLIDTPHFWGTNLSRVTTLCFGNSEFWADFDLTMLSLCPVLHDLTLFTRDTRISQSIDGSQPPIIFEHLRILRVHGYIPPAALIKLVAPALEELHLKANAHNITSIHPLQVSFQPLCQYIFALLPKAVSAEEPEWATNLSELVQQCPRIKSLYISGWMEEECKIHMTGHDVVLHVQSGN